MNQHNEQTKWFSRVGLIVLSAVLVYLVIQPSYNIAHWVPHNALRRLGANYDHLLWIEHNIDLVLHAVGGFLVTALIIMSKLPIVGRSEMRALCLVCVLCIGVEISQFAVGRGAPLREQSLDLLLGIFGSFMAYLAFKKNN